jgi:Glycosyltransferase family 87
MLSSHHPASRPVVKDWLRLLAVAACFSFSMWFYVARILIPHQIADAAAHQRPRGNLSDLYPRWLGARELWQNGRNPYSPSVTRDIQAGYYGRPLDPQRPGDPVDQQGFAYPVYVTFLLIPTLGLPFEVVRVGFTWLLVALTAASLLCWLRALQWRPGWTISVTLLSLTLASFGGLQGVKLQQLSLVVAALIATCAALLVGGHLFAAGVVLAIATIKPQLVALLALFLTQWVLREWHTRRALLYGFGLTLAALCLGAQWILPGWLDDFWHALHQYQRYTGGESRLDVLLGPIGGKILAGAIVVWIALACLRAGSVPRDDPRFMLLFATILAATLVVMPNFAPYNELILLPAVLLVVRDFGEAQRDIAFRVSAYTAGFFLSWGWIAAFALTVASLFTPPATIQRAWAVPLWSELVIAPAFLLVLGIPLAHARKTDSNVH